jgi:hypothetical protein
VSHKILHILEKDHRWFGQLKEPSNLKKEISMTDVTETVRSTQANSLAHSRDAEWLAWEAGNQDFVIR